MRLSLFLGMLLYAVLSSVFPVRRAGAAVDPPAGRRAALVNGVLITGEDFDNELQRVERLNLRGKRPGGANKKQVLENLIVRELLFQEARRVGVRVSAQEVAARVGELSGRLAGAAALEGALDRMGLSAGALEAQIERGLVLEKYLERSFSRGATVSDDQVSDYYQDHQDEFREPLRLRLSHILVKLDPAWDAARKEQARQRILALGKKVAEGVDFAALAREASDCYSAKNGGDLGYFLPGQLARPLEDEARDLKVGEVSGVVEDRYGLHLLKLTELRPAAVLPLEKVKEKIRARLSEEKELKALAPVVQRLRAAAKVEILLNE